VVKLQQFNILLLEYDTIKNSKFNLNVSIQEAKESEELIAVADNECLRAIRRITNHKFDKTLLRDLLLERKRISRGENSENSRQRISDINAAIDDLLYIPEFISVQFKTTKDYDKLNTNGFVVNGKKYIWLMCGAGHQRTNRAMYVDKSIFDKLNLVLTNGANLKDMVLAKYNAYYALSSSATYQVRKPRVCVVADCEIKMAKEVDFVAKESITRCNKELVFNLFDGEGLISPEYSRAWAEDVGIYDYIPSAWGVRCAFIKGMCVTFDFHKFAKEVAGNSLVKDLWGNWVDIQNIDLILTQSQFKLWNAYDSWKDYEDNLWINGWSWGISKVSPKIEDEKTCMFTNYQFLQVLNLDDNDIFGLCKQTVDWLKGVSCGDLDKTELYLLGSVANNIDAKKAFDSVQDNFLKCLLMDNSLICDNYIKNRIIKSINKKIKESYFGNLIVDGNFMARISDPYALCEHIFGLKINGLLSANEHYSYFWNCRNVKNVVAMRSPLTYKTEAHRLNFKDNENVNDWYKYITSGIIYNVWGVDCLLEAGADYDFDIVATTNNEYFLKGIIGTDIPVVYEAKKPPKEKVEYSRLAKIAGAGFNTQIGYLTNLSTTLYEMQSHYVKWSVEWQEIENRLKLCCELQSMQIDKAKGLVIDDIPDYWTEYREAIKLDGGEKGVNCELLIESRPYFMRYRYSKYNLDYKNYISDMKRYCTTVWGDMETDEYQGTQQYQDMSKYYQRKCKLLNGNGIMNKICRHMESELREIRSKNSDNEVNIYDILWENEQIDNEICEKLLKIREEYIEFKKNKALNSSEYATWEQYFRAIRNKCLVEITSNIEELSKNSMYICYKLFPNKPKDFAWDCFGRGVMLKFMSINNNASLPLVWENGDIEYLGKRYWRASVTVGKQQCGETSCEDCVQSILDYDISDDGFEQQLKEMSEQ